MIIDVSIRVRQIYAMEGYIETNYAPIVRR